MKNKKRGSIDKRSIEENMDFVLLALDELVDGGYFISLLYFKIIFYLFDF